MSIKVIRFNGWLIDTNEEDTVRNEKKCGDIRFKGEKNNTFQK